MAQRDTNLPEGTDTIVPGALETDTSHLTGSTATTTGHGSSSSSSASGLMDKVKSSGGKLSGQAADTARGFVGQGIDRSADALSNVGKLIGDTASGIDQQLGQEYGDYARRAADTLQNTATKLSSKDADELIGDTRDFIRKSPGIALAGAAIVGFALARMIKSGFEGSDSGEGEEHKRSRS